MSPAAAKVRAAAMALPEDERLQLGRELLGHTADADAGDIERAWAPALEQRAAGKADGSIRVVPFDDAIANVRNSRRSVKHGSLVHG